MSKTNDPSSHISQSSRIWFTLGQINCIPSTEEKYFSFSKKIKVDDYKSRKNDETVSLNFEIRFIDSFTFLERSLANLVSNLQPADFKNTKAIIKSNVSLLIQKVVYPYDYGSSINKFSETQLPPKTEFYSKLNDEDISDTGYKHALNVWNTFNCKAIRDYHNLYLKSDVLLLADVCLKILQKLVWNITIVTQRITSHLPASLRMRVLKKQVKNCNFSTITNCWWCLEKAFVVE